MSAQDIRQGESPFYDNVHFSRGFSKSGNFTLAEAEILTFFGRTLLAIENGELTPSNAAEESFLSVVKGNKEAETKVERTWMKYLSLSRGKKRIYTLNSKPTISEDDYTAHDLGED